MDESAERTSILITIYLGARTKIRTGCWESEAIFERDVEPRRRVSNFLIGASFPVVYLMACS